MVSTVKESSYNKDNTYFQYKRKENTPAVISVVKIIELSADVVVAAVVVVVAGARVGKVAPSASVIKGNLVMRLLGNSCIGNRTTCDTTCTKTRLITL